MPLQLKKKLAAIRLRLQCIDLCRRVLWLTGWVAGALLLLILSVRLLPIEWEPPVVLPVAAAGVVLLTALVWSAFNRVRLFDAAVRADEALGLHERLSTAVLLRDPQSEPEQAVVRDAERHAGRIRVGDSFPLRLGRHARRAAAPLLLLLPAWLLLPDIDLPAVMNPPAPTQLEALTLETPDEAVERLEALAREIGQTEQLKRKLEAERLQRELQALARDLRERRIDAPEALKKMTQLQDRLEQRREQIEEQLARAREMRTTRGGEHTRQMREAMEKGNFKQAAAELKDLQDQVKRGELTQQDQADLERELAEMAEQFGTDTELGQALAEAAARLGEGSMNEALAGLETAEMNMQDLQEMLEELEGLESVVDEMDARELSLSQCKSCDKAGSVTCQACGAGGRGGDAGRKAGMWTAGQGGPGQGMGRAGQGRGGVARSSPHDVRFTKERLKGQMEAGRIIARMKVPGSQKPGEITTEYERIRLEQEQQAEDTIRREVMPLEHKALVRDYFAAIKQEDAAEPVQE